MSEVYGDFKQEYVDTILKKFNDVFNNPDIITSDIESEFKNLHKNWKGEIPKLGNIRGYAIHRTAAIATPILAKLFGDEVSNLYITNDTTGKTAIKNQNASAKEYNLMLTYQAINDLNKKQGKLSKLTDDSMQVEDNLPKQV